MTRRSGFSGTWLACLTLTALASAPAGNAQDSLPHYQARDRGPGQPTSMFGTYIRKGELLVYPFVEYYRDSDAEYKPAEFGFGLDQDFRGKYRATEGLLFLGYGISDRLAIEFEAAVITATLDRAPEDNSGMPARIKESGVGDVEGQLRYRWNRETARRPEWFSYLEIVAPLQKNKQLIGTQHWEYKFGSGLVKGFSFGTVTLRGAAEYSGEESKVELGEVALEYVRRLSRSWLIYTGVEGTQDEVEFITEAQWRLKPNVTLKLNNAIGVTSKATDWAPEVGVVFSIPLGGAER